MRINQLRESNFIDADEADEHSRGLIQPTPRNLKRFEQFLKVKWAERSKQRYDSWGDTQDQPWQPPATLEGACKFTSLFANRLFGGRMRGNQQHQFLELPNGKIIDPVPVPGVANPQQHDEEFWMNPDHKDSLESCLPRVNEWVQEFMSLSESRFAELDSIITELTKGVKKGSQKREKIGFASDDPSKYVGKWEEYTEPQGINSKAGKKMTKTEGAIGPVMTRGMANSSTGLGAAPPQIEIEQTPYQKRTNGKQKMTGHKAPMVVVKRNVAKSTKNKNRKLNSPVTEVFNDSSNSYPYHEEGGWTTVDTQIDGLEIIVGMEDIQNYNPELPPGVNVGMVSQTEDGIHMGVEPAKVGMSTRDTIRLFNTLMNIVREYAETKNPERMYFVAVKPMEGIYQRLIRRFVDTNEWNIKVIKDVPIPMLGTKLTTYMIERKNHVTEMVRYPKHKEFNADYEVDEGGEIVAKAAIHAGVIEEFMVRDDVGGNDFRGKYMSGLMSAIVRDADLTNSNMSMQIHDPDDLEMKRFLERFGFRHFGDGVYKRTAGAITPPSVVY